MVREEREIFLCTILFGFLRISQNRTLHLCPAGFFLVNAYLEFCQKILNFQQIGVANVMPRLVVSKLRHAKQVVEAALL